MKHSICKKTTLYSIIIFLISVQFACKLERAPDVSHIEVHTPILRFEQDIFQLDTTKYHAFSFLAKKYNVFYYLYVDELMGFGKTDDPAKEYRKKLVAFTKNKDIVQLYDSVMVKFPDLKALEAEFEEAFRYYKYYFPNKKVPDLISHLSAFGPAAVTLDSIILSVNLDMYLGKDFPFYNVTEFPRYISRRFEPEYIVPNSMKAYLQGLYEIDERDSKLLDQMVHKGKLLYALDKLLPYTADSLKIGYSQEQLDWCQYFEAKIWAFFIEKELLYETEYRKYFKFINESPTTSGMPQESPGRIGEWLGWQIVRKFMKENPEVSLSELMKLKDGQKILSMAKYKPRK